MPPDSAISPSCPSNKRQKFQERKEDAGRDTDRDHGDHAARGSLVDVQTPAIRWKRLQFDDQAGKQEQQGRQADRTGDLRAGLYERIDIERAGGVVEQHRAEQEEG